MDVTSSTSRRIFSRFCSQTLPGTISHVKRPVRRSSGSEGIDRGRWDPFSNPLSRSGARALVLNSLRMTAMFDTSESIPFPFRYFLLEIPESSLFCPASLVDDRDFRTVAFDHGAPHTQHVPAGRPVGQVQTLTHVQQDLLPSHQQVHRLPTYNEHGQHCHRRWSRRPEAYVQRMILRSRLTDSVFKNTTTSRKKTSQDSQMLASTLAISSGASRSTPSRVFCWPSSSASLCSSMCSGPSARKHAAYSGPGSWAPPRQASSSWPRRSRLRLSWRHTASISAGSRWNKRMLFAGTGMDPLWRTDRESSRWLRWRLPGSRGCLPFGGESTPLAVIWSFRSASLSRFRDANAGF